MDLILVQTVVVEYLIQIQCGVTGSAHLAAVYTGFLSPYFNETVHMSISPQSNSVESRGWTKGDSIDRHLWGKNDHTQIRITGAPFPLYSPVVKLGEGARSGCQLNA